jgi:hypothetical protein
MTWANMSEREQSGTKFQEMVINDQNWPELARIGQKWPEMAINK